MPRDLSTRDLKLKGFKLTVSTKYDISELTVEKIASYVKKNCDMGMVVLENGESGVLHLHALLNFADGRVKRNLSDHFWKFFVKPFNEECIQKWAVRFDVLYDEYWRMEYLKKEATRRLVLDNYDDGRAAEYYAPFEVQAYLQSVSVASDACDPFYAMHAVEFNEWIKRDTPGPPRVVTLTTCLEYLHHRMFVAKNMKIISQHRRAYEIADRLYRYVTSNVTLDFEDRKWVASREGPVLDFRS